MKNVNEMTVGELKEQLAQADEIRKVLNMGPEEIAKPSADSHWKIGKLYFIRLVTHHICGKLDAVTPTELVLSDAAWIADSGRFAKALETGKLEEVEPFPDGDVIIGRGALIDAALWTHSPQRETK